MKITLDTNVLIAAFISRGVCDELLAHCVRHHQVVTSAFILGELQEKLTGKFNMQAREVAAAVQLIRENAEVVQLAPMEDRVSRDADDDNVLATAIAGESDCLVTGDKDLLVLEAYAGIDVLEPSAFWEYEARR